MNYGATEAEWLHFDKVLDLGTDLLPCVANPKAEIAATSKLKQLGKTPSVYNADGLVVGMKDWTSHHASDQEIRRWAKQPDYGILVICRRVKALDLDISDQELVEQVQSAIAIELGVQLPIRRRANSSKCLLVFHLKDDMPKRVLQVEHGMIEFLANGQQFVAIGTHPSGVRYDWPGGLPTEIPEISREQLDNLMISLEVQFGTEPMREISSGTRNQGETLDVEDPVADFLTDKGLVLETLNDGSLAIQCPWNDEHTGGEIGNGSTVWFRAGTKGHLKGHFKCLHAHCSDRTDAGFFQAIGYEEDVSKDFENLDTSGDPVETVDTSQLSQAAQAKRIKPSPFERKDPALFPRRQWLYGNHLIRKFLSATVSPGGVGKSSLELADAVAMASGQNLTGSAVSERLNVWYWNGEDPKEEIERRVLAICNHYNIDQGAIVDRLFLDSGRDMEIILAKETRDGAIIAEPIVGALIAAIREYKIDVLMIDPFVSAHRVSENDNNAIDRVAKTFSRIAELTGCAISLVHHSRKTGGAQVTAEDARGASALISAARSVRVLNQMTATEAAQAGITGNPRLYFSVENGKGNLAPPADARIWFKMTSVPLGNNDGLIEGDFVGVAVPWEWTTASVSVSNATLRDVQDAIASGNFRSSDRSNTWVGRVVGDILGLNVDEDKDKKRIKQLLKDWIKEGYLREETAKDENRMMRPFVRVGVLAEEQEGLDAA